MKQILFNTDMVRAILEGRKTATRRVVKPQPTSWVENMFKTPGTNIWRTCGSSCWFEYKAPFVPGDILWVRETWAEMPYGFVYRADGEEPEEWDVDDRWRPSIHMPREAARIFLRVTGVRVERLQEISGEDIRAEGVLGTHFKAPTRGAFVDVWDRTVKPADLPAYGWDANPWVWVIEFERISKVEGEAK